MRSIMNVIEFKLRVFKYVILTSYISIYVQIGRYNFRDNYSGPNLTTINTILTWKPTELACRSLSVGLINTKHENQPFVPEIGS